MSRPFINAGTVNVKCKGKNNANLILTNTYFERDKFLPTSKLNSNTIAMARMHSPREKGNMIN